MKKLTLFAIALLASVASFAALNPFAYGLSSQLSADETKLTVNYSLNAPATAVNIVVLNGETVVKHISSDKITKGSHTIEIPTADFPKTTNLTWRIEVSGSSVKTPTLHDTSYHLFHPSSVDIDNNPENPTFGLILANEAMQSVVSETDTYLSAGFGAGIFAFNAAFEPIKNGKKPGFNGGITFTTGRYDNSGSTAYAPRRIRISEDGRIFVTSLNTDGTYLWEVNPENLDKWTPVFKGTRNANFELVDAQSNFIAAPNVGFDVKGSGKNLKLLMLSSNKNGFSFAYSGYQTHEYNLGTATEWTTTPTKKILGGKYIISYTSAQVEYDNEGGVWICQNRTEATDVQPSLIHINAAGVEDYKEILHVRTNAGIRFNKDFTKIIIAGNKTVNYNSKGAAISSKKATIYTISKDANGKPVLTEDLVIDMSTLGTNLNDFAFDYAGNLYGVSNSGEKIAVWAMPTNGSVVTPAPSKYAFKIGAKSYTVTATANDTAMGTITGAGTCYEGENVKLTATANKGYEFVNWTKGEEIVSTENPYTFTVTTDVALIANFELKIIGVVKRALQLGESVVVLTHEADGTAHIYNVVGETITEVSQEGVVAVDPENAGDLLAISDIALTEDGKLLAINKIVCQASGDQVDAGYKRGETRVYIWNDLASVPTIWFESKQSSNWYRSIQGHTMAYKGTSTNGTLFTTGVTASGVKFRYSVYNVIDGVHTDPSSNNSDYYHFTKGSAQTTDNIGANYEINVSPLAENTWVLDGELIDPFEITDPLTYNTEVTAGATVNEDLGKKYNGATYVTVGEQVLMVAPYATEGKLAGVKVLDITAGLDAANEVAVANLDAAINATTAATAVVVDEDELIITLVGDATLYTLTAELSKDPSTGTAVDNTIIAAQAQKVLRNGQVLIIRDGKTYNMMGQEVK